MSNSQNPSPEEVFEQLFNKIDFTKVMDLRKALNQPPVYSYKDEKKILFNMFDRLMIMRTNKGTYFSQSHGLWMVSYFRDKKKYKKNEKFSIEILFCPISKHHYIIDKGKYD